MTIKNFLIPAAILLFLFSLPAQADQIVFKNGDRLSGDIISMRDAGGLYFQSNITGDMRVPWQSISELYDQNLNAIAIPQFPAPLTSPQSDLSRVSGNQPVQTWTQAAAGKPVAPLSGFTNNEDDTTQDKLEWKGRINLGGSLDDGNSHNKSVTFDADVEARNEKNRFNFGGEANWEESEGTETENDQQVFALYDRFLTEKYFIGGKLQFEKDKFEELDLRSRVGLYNGYQFYEQDDLNLQIKAGAEYIHEQYQNTDNESNIAASWGLAYDQKFFEGAFQLFHEHSLAIPVDETDAFLFDSGSGVRVPVGKHLTGTAQVDFDWNNAPPPGTREADTSYSLKLGYEW